MSVSLVTVRCTRCDALVGVVVREGSHYEWVDRRAKYDKKHVTPLLDPVGVVGSQCRKCEHAERYTPYLIPVEELLAAADKAERSTSIPCQMWARLPLLAERVGGLRDGNPVLTNEPQC